MALYGRVQGENIEPLQLTVQLYVLLISLKCDAGIIYYILYSTVHIHILLSALYYEGMSNIVIVSFLCFNYTVFIRLNG